MAHTTTQMGGTRMSFIAFCRKYAAADVCLKHIDRVRWADGACCPACGGAEASITTRTDRTDQAVPEPLLHFTIHPPLNA